MYYLGNSTKIIKNIIKNMITNSLRNSSQYFRVNTRFLVRY